MIKSFLCLILLNTYLFAFILENEMENRNLLNGSITEQYINEYMKSNNARQINVEVGRNGIDGMFYKKVNGSMEVYVIESKYNNARLGDTIADGEQMTKQWKLKKIDEKLSQLKRIREKNYITSAKKIKIKKEINLLMDAKRVVEAEKDKAFLFKIKPLAEEYKELKILQKLPHEKKVYLKHLEDLKARGRLESSYKSKLYYMDTNGNILQEAKRYAVSNSEIDLKKTYKIGSKNRKQQKLLSHTIRKEKRLYIEKNKLKNIKKHTAEYRKQINKIEKIKKSKPIFINNLNRSNKKTFSRINRISFSKISSGLLKYGGKATARRIALVGVKSTIAAIPIIGVAAQIALDIQMQIQIEEIGKVTEINKAFIVENREYIQSLENSTEQKILLLKEGTERNEASINENREYLSRLKEEYEILGTVVEKNSLKLLNLDNQLYDMVDRVDEVEKIVLKNMKDIENIKNGILKTAINQLDTYYNTRTKDIDSLKNCINNFEVIQSINNLDDEINDIVINSLNIAYIEKALQYKQSKRDYSFLKEKIVKNFYNILQHDNLSIALNSFASMYELMVDDKKIYDEIVFRYKKYLREQIEKMIKNNRFEDAIKLAKNFKRDTKDDLIYNQVLKLREKNFKDYKNELSDFEKIDTILGMYQNNLLNKESVKILYNNDMYEHMFQILSKLTFDNNDFKYKVYYLAYKQLDIKKAEKFKILIIKNSTYSKELKNYLEKH